MEKMSLQGESVCSAGSFWEHVKRLDPVQSEHAVEELEEENGKRRVLPRSHSLSPIKREPQHCRSLRRLNKIVTQDTRRSKVCALQANCASWPCLE